MSKVERFGSAATFRQRPGFRRTSRTAFECETPFAAERRTERCPGDRTKRRSGTWFFEIPGLLLLLCASLASELPRAYPAETEPTDGTSRDEVDAADAGSQAIDTVWAMPEGRVRGRRVLTRLTRLQEAVRETPDSETGWAELLQPLHEDILAARADHFVTPESSPDNDDSLRGLKSVVEDMIAELPEPGFAAWQLLIAERAASELRSAVRSADWQAIRRIASQDVHTPAGYEAIDRLGNRYLDDGRTSLALQQFDRLLRSASARESREPELSIRVAAAWTRLSEHGRARQVMVELAEWLKAHPEVSNRAFDASVSDGFSVSETIKRVRTVARPDEDSFRLLRPGPSRHSRPGFLPVARQPVFGPSARVVWATSTAGFHVTPTEEDRARFLAPLADSQLLSPGSDEEPYPESRAESAALVELGLFGGDAAAGAGEDQHWSSPP